MEQGVVSQLALQIYDLMGDKLRVKGANLRTRVRKAGRLLPKTVRRAAGELIEAQDMAENPNLATRLDPDAVTKAHRTCLRYLKEIDPKAAKSRARYNFAALISAQFLLIVGLAIALLQWRGLL
jgi:hypothetical protein